MSGAAQRAVTAARHRCGWLTLCVAMTLSGRVLGEQAALQHEPVLDQVMALLAQRQHGTADFTETKYLAVLTRPLVSTGELHYDAPDHLEERTLTPKAQSLVLDHGMLDMQLGKRHRSVRLADYPQLAPLLDCIRATLAGDRAALERVFALEFHGDLDQWQLQLQPRAPGTLASVKRIQIHGQHDAISTVEVLQSDGDRSLMNITARP